MEQTRPDEETAVPALDGEARKQSDRRLWKVLALGGPVGFLLASPYFLPLLSQMREHAAAVGHAGPPLAVLIAAQLAQVSVLVAAAAWVGARLSRRTGFDAPYLRARLDGKPAQSFVRQLPLALIAGALFSAAVLAINLLASPHLPDALRRHPLPPLPAGEKLIELLRGASSAFYGGIVEELLMRWGVLSALAALAGVLGAKAGARFWIANLVSACLFGLGHLPAVHALGVPIGGLVVAYVVLANGLAGLVCGFLFYKRGLETAMVAHGVGDICLHALPLLAFTHV